MNDYIPRRGDRVALEHTTDPYTRLRPGDEGTVTTYDPQLGQLGVRWDTGSTLSMLLLDGDRVRPAVLGGCKHSWAFDRAKTMRDGTIWIYERCSLCGDTRMYTR